MSMKSIMDQYERYRQILFEINRGNKDSVFDALAAAGVTAVVVDFDGEGDSGQINGVVALRGGDHIALPATKVAVRVVPYGKTNAFRTEQDLEQAIETLCYNYLGETHDGWENNDGAYGEFRFGVAARTIALEFNGRFTDTWTDNHSF